MTPSQSGSDLHPVALLDVGRGNAPLREQVLARLAAIYDAGCFINGPDCQKLEHRITEICGVEYAIGCASGSDALLLALMALGIGHGDEVLVPSFTFFATASAVTRVGARPIFVDIDPTTFNIDPAALAAAVSPRTRAIIPVHLFGQCADMGRIREIADRYRLAVIEDAAQAIGASFEGRPACSMGEIGCLSFYPTKNLGGCGDAGMVTARDAAVADKLRKLANHGMQPRYYHGLIGINSRLDSFQAAILDVKLDHLDHYVQARRSNAARYDQQLESLARDGVLQLPLNHTGNGHVWNQYTIRIPGGRRDAVRESLRQEGIGSEVYYPIPLHRQECFAFLGYGPGSLPHTELAAREVLSLPIYPELTRAEQDRVVSGLKRALGVREFRKVA